MEIGTEISQKIRSAIKAKLIELGAYVDDELPDYIMVMVANKKTQKQMTDDLSLFLSTNTEKFTSWLHGLLKKLQSINTEQAATKQKVKEKQKGEKKKRKSSHSEKPTKTSDQEEGKSSTAENIVQKETSKKEKSGTDTKDGVKKEKVKVTAKPSGTQVGKAEQKTEDEQGTEINISENTDEFNEENKEIEKHEKVKQLSTGKPPPAKVKKTEKTSDTSKEAAKIASRENRVSGKARSSLESEKSKVLPKEAVKKKPSSFVAAVKRRYEEEEEHEEYDPMNPAVGSVASVVRGPSRKSSIPKSMQANKSLLMKAVSDAEKSVTSSKKQEDIPESKPAMRSDRKAVDLSHRLKTAAGLQLVSRSRRKEMQQGMKSAVENDARETLSSKKRRSNEDLKGMKFKVKNEGQTSRVEAKKTPPKAPAVAPTRVAAAALKDIEKNKTGQATAVVSSPAGEDEEEEYNDEERSTSLSDDDSEDEMSENDEESEGTGVEEAEEDSSDEEIEIEVTDRAAQTVLNMRQKNFNFSGTSNKAACFERSAQTEPSVTGVAFKSKLAKERLEEIDSSLMNLFIDNMLPFDFVENDTFKTFTKTLEPKYHFPKKKKLITNIGLLFNNVKEDLKKELRGTTSVIFTHSMAGTLEGQVYQTVNAHYLTEDWSLRSAALATVPQDSEDQVGSCANILESCRLKWGLPLPQVVTDMSELDLRVLDELGWKRIPCFGSCVCRLVSHCIRNVDVCEFIDRGRNLVRAVQSCSLAQEIFLQKKKLLLPKTSVDKKLELDDKSNWMSTLEMISVLAEQTPALHAAVMDTELTNQGVDLRNQLYSFGEQSVLESLIKLLSPFRTAAEILTSRGSPTLQKVVPIFIKLDKALESDAEDCELIKNLKTEVKLQIDSLLAESRDVCLLACLIHPQTKQMAFVNPDEKESVRNLLLREVTMQCEKESLSDQKANTDGDEGFRKGKKAQHKQTKAMSDVAEETDERIVVVSEEGKNESNDSTSDLKTDKDEENIQGKDTGKAGEDIDISSEGSQCSFSSEDTRRVTEVRLSADKVSSRKVLEEESDKIQPGSSSMTNLSITVENDWLDDVICVAEEKKSPEEMAKIEVDLFLAEPASTKNPLLWWKEKHLLYPRISQVARRLLCVPASRINTEEVFSLENKTEKKVFNIKAEHIDMIVFLKENKCFYS